jgi:predicted PurR-regulated permease PerM
MQGAIPFARRDRFRRHGQWRRGNAIAAEVGFQPIVNSASVTDDDGDDSRNLFTAMPAPKIRTSASDAIIGLWKVALTVSVVATLYVARELLIPFALSALLTFLLAPLVTRIERWIGRIAAVLVVVALIFSAMGLAGWLLTRQLADLANKLPEYKGNIVAKMHAFDVPQGGKFTQLSETLDELKKELPGGDEPAAPVSRGYGYPAGVSPPSRPEAPAQAIENSKTDPIALVQLIVAPLVGPLGMAALVVLLVIFMLLQREDLRNRVIRLIGQGRISATTRAMDDAGCRVSRFLLMQVQVPDRVARGARQGAPDAPQHFGVRACDRQE